MLSVPAAAPASVPAPRFDVPLAPLTTIRCGGPARRFIEASTDAEIVEAVVAADDQGEPLLLLGRGSNLVISDAGFPGTVIAVGTRGVDIENASDDQRLVTAAAGEPWDLVVARCVGDQLVGLESLSGIPGSVGAAPIQNIGAYGIELASVLTTVTAFDRSRRRIAVLSGDEGGFGYRDSRFKREPNRWVVLSVTMCLRRDPEGAAPRYPELTELLGGGPGDSFPPELVRKAVLKIRRAKGMVLDISDHDTWSVGSFFVNPIVSVSQARQLPDAAPKWPLGSDRVKLSAAWLIEHAGFSKGWGLDSGSGVADAGSDPLDTVPVGAGSNPLGVGPAATISTKHTLAITNRGVATTADVLALARVVTAAVRERFGVELRPEPDFVGCSLDIRQSAL